MKKIFIAAMSGKAKTGTVLTKVLKVLRKNGVETVVEHGSPGDLSEFDAVITIGGDGAILRYGKAAAAYGLPLLGINTGNLGFMAALSSDNAEQGVLKFLKGVGYSRRALFSVELKSCVYEPGGLGTQRRYLILNDAVFSKVTYSHLPTFRVGKCGRSLMKFRGDGLIVSTAGGSTAYSLSAGGPVLESELTCALITPNCPHSLRVRPIVVALGNNDKQCITVSADENAGAYLSVDGEPEIHVGDSDKAEIILSDLTLNLADFWEESFAQRTWRKL